MTQYKLVVKNDVKNVTVDGLIDGLVQLGELTKSFSASLSAALYDEVADVVMGGIVKDYTGLNKYVRGVVYRGAKKKDVPAVLVAFCKNTLTRGRAGGLVTALENKGVLNGFSDSVKKTRPAATKTVEVIAPAVSVSATTPKGVDSKGELVNVSPLDTALLAFSLLSDVEKKTFIESVKVQENSLQTV